MRQAVHAEARNGACVMIDHLIVGNLKFRESDFDGNIELFKKLTLGQSPKVLWIGCSDSRVLPERITSSDPGEIFVQRNIGNIVPIHDWNFATVLEYALVHLKVSDVVVCGHSDCGAMKALDKETTDVYIPLWLNNAREAKALVDARIKVPQTSDERKERSRQIETENIRIQIEHLKTYPLVKSALSEGRIEIHGLYYDLSTGKLTKVF
jgi:carbonic anhydrase